MLSTVHLLCAPLPPLPPSYTHSHVHTLTGAAGCLVPESFWTCHIPRAPELWAKNELKLWCSQLFIEEGWLWPLAPRKARYLVHFKNNSKHLLCTSKLLDWGYREWGTKTIFHICVGSKMWHKWTYLQNRNRITDIEKRLVVSIQYLLINHSENNMKNNIYNIYIYIHTHAHIYV